MQAYELILEEEETLNVDATHIEVEDIEESKIDN